MAEIVKETAEKIAAMDYGVILHHYDLESMLEAKYKTQQYTTRIEKLKRLLLDKAKMLENIKGVGYKITEPDDYIDNSVLQFKRAAKRMRYGEKILTHAPVDKMSLYAKENHRKVSDRVAILNASMRGAVVEIKQLNNTKQLKA